MTTTVDGVDIHHETIGAGPDVVLVHGITDCSATWGPVPELLAAQRRVTTLDLRGMGRSGDATDYGAAGMARDVAAVVSAAGVENPLVVGHSLGGVVVTAYAGTAPVRGVVNVDQTLRLSFFQEGLRGIEPLLRDPAAFPEVIRSMFASMDGDQLTPEQAATVAGHRRLRQEVVLGVWNQILQNPLETLDADIEAMTAGVTAPYLSLQFEDPGEEYSAWLKRLIPQAVVEHWTAPDGGTVGHYGHLVEPERFVQRVLAFDH